MSEMPVLSRKRILAPSILAADPLRLAAEIASLPSSAEWIHIDIMDGHYVPNMNGAPGIVKALKQLTDRILDVHLMVAEPERVLDLYLAAGADYLTIHQEATFHPLRWLSYIRQAGCKAGISLNPGTSLTQAEELLPEADLLLLMSVNPGFGGQSFIPSVLPKIKKARRLIDEQKLGTLLEVDGGVSAANAAEVWEAGIDVVVAGSAVFGETDRAAGCAAILQV